MAADEATYANWVERFDTLDAADVAVADAFVRRLSIRPRFDVVMPVYNPPERFLEEAIESAKRQIYPDWTLCIFDDCSTERHVAPVLAGAAEGDPRIRIARGAVNGGIAHATNAAIRMGSGEFVVFLDHDDVLARHALLLLAHCVEGCPDVNLMYGDMDLLDERGKRRNPFFKPDYDHELLLGYNFVWGTLRRSLLEALGGMREGFPGSEDYDLSLRAVERISERTIRHISHVIYHWRMVPTSFAHTQLPATVDSAHRAVREHCGRRGILAEVGPAPRLIAVNDVRPRFQETPRVIFVVEGGTEAERATWLSRFAHAAEEHALVHSAVSLEEGGPIGVRRNAVLRAAETEFVAFVDVRLWPRGSDWPTEMVGPFTDEKCAAVAPRILSSDGTVEQCGLLLGVREEEGSDLPIARAFSGLAAEDPGYAGLGLIGHSASAVGGGAMVVRTSAALSLGGFDEIMADAGAVDVDFSLRARDAALTLVNCPRLTFDASRPAPYFEDPDSRALLVSRWGVRLEQDPFYNPNLSSVGTRFDLAVPPRLTFPWRK